MINLNLLSINFQEEKGSTIDLVLVLVYIPGNMDKFLENSASSNGLLLENKVEGIPAVAELEEVERKEELVEVIELPNDEEFLNLFRNSSENKYFRLCDEGVGGTYFIESKRGKKFAIFKPGDEESGMEKNPKGEFVSRFQGVAPGEGYLREIAAYMLDHGNRARVPFTQLAEENFGGSVKRGSLQKFVDNEGSMVDFGSTGLNSENVHSIGQLDVRMFNMDRNEENLLIVRGKNGNEIIPIDHSYSLPKALGEANFIWMNWKQSKEPFSADMIKYINDIDIDNDAKILRSLKFSEESIDVMKLSTMVLKRGAAKGWTLHQVGSFLSRPQKNTPSPLELSVELARSNSDCFWKNMEKILSDKIH